MNEIRKNKNISEELFDRISSVLEEARKNVVRSVNKNLIYVYWYIGYEIVNTIQQGESRAEYGKEIIEDLSKRLQATYKRGFSVTNLKYFRSFYLAYPNKTRPIFNQPEGESLFLQKSHPSGGELEMQFNSNLTWSHYRALMRLENIEARYFYEKETSECGWTKEQLERQIQTKYYERILKNHGNKGLLPEKRDRLQGETVETVHLLKAPYILEFLDLPDSHQIHESHLEQSIIDNLQSFLLEIGKGFSFVARQKQIKFDDEEFYIDLVFYNFILKCFLLIDLKIGKLTHKDIGQMDGYVRLFEDKYKIEGDNPTIGLILCSNKSEAVAKYSVLKESRQIFAAKYLDFLPTEKELQREIERERKLIEITGKNI